MVQLTFDVKLDKSKAQFTKRCSRIWLQYRDFCQFTQGYTHLEQHNKKDSSYMHHSLCRKTFLISSYLMIIEMLSRWEKSNCTNHNTEKKMHVINIIYLSVLFCHQSSFKSIWCSKRWSRHISGPSSIRLNLSSKL